MGVREDRPRLADRGRGITVRNVRPVPIASPAHADDLPDYLRALRRLADADDLRTAYAGCTIAIEVADRDGDGTSLAMAYSQRASVARRLGDLPAARADADAAAELLDVSGVEPGSPLVALLLSRRLAVLIDLGDLAAADNLLAATDLGGDLPDAPEYLLLRYVRGRLHTASARLGEGLADLYHCGERLAARRSDHPGILPWRSAAASVLHRLRAGEAAERLVAEEVALTRRAALASALGRALRIQGQIRPGEDGLAAAEESVRVLQSTPRRFELATALVDLGGLLNASRRRAQARRVLRDGLELAERCGSPALAAKARTAYLAAGGKRRPVAPPPAETS
jgi:tetratricopeptide (TPR) repeat protein